MPFVALKRASRLPIRETLDSVQDVFIGASMKRVYLLFTFVSYMTAEYFSDLDWSVILTCGSLFQTLGWFALLHKITNQRSVAGLSLHTIELLMIVYAVRLSATTFRSGYLPVDYSGDGLYQAADFLTLAIACGIRKCMKDYHRKTYDEEADTLDLRKRLPLCVLVALFVHGDLNDSFLFDTLYYVAINVETLAMMPQLWMFVRRKGEVDGITSHFVVLQTLGRICSLIFWWYGSAEIGEFTTYNVAGIYIVGALVVQVLQSLDFVYYYAKARLTGKQMVLPVYI
jgi:uncharacterized protein with PQ loop repeat